MKLSEAFAILEAHGLNEHDIYAEHDIIMTTVDAEKLDPESEDGKKLIQGRWFISEEFDNTWCKFV